MSLTLEQAKPKLDQAIEHLVEELKKLRTGRAASSMLDGVMVEVYGQSMPLQHIATITAVDAQLLQVSPFDPNNLSAISAAIREDQSLGLNPADDGKVVRLPIPPMTTERRESVVKQLYEKVEETNIVLRNIRREVLNAAKAELKEKDISEDEYNRIDKQMNEYMEEYKKTIDETAQAKDAEIMTV